MITSSAYKEIRCSCSPIWMPDRPFCVVIAIAKGSMASMNSIGDREHPWQVDLSTITGLETVPFV